MDRQPTPCIAQTAAKNWFRPCTNSTIRNIHGKKELKELHNRTFMSATGESSDLRLDVGLAPSNNGTKILSQDAQGKLVSNGKTIELNCRWNLVF
ncbi:hypothetical protein C5167_028482 [Papaver somniferum]|nr:hypothetical protein C5167_028482 [Papaver somniferum]